MLYTELTADNCRAEQIPVVNAKNLDQESFYQQYWSANKPVLIKGAIDHWPARSSWGNPLYLLSELGELPIKVRREPQNEAKMLPGNNGLYDVTFKEFCQELESGSSEPVWLHAVPIFLPSSRKSDQAPSRKAPKFYKCLSDLGLRDFEYFRFLGNVGASRVYPSWRVFLYRNSFTDWHAHITDSHLMCQVSGRKEVFVLPPNEGFRTIEPMYEDKKRSFEMNEDFHEKICHAKPYRLVVDEGDALHIPVHWYHMVRPVDRDQFGVTVAYAFASPLRVNGDARLLANEKFYGQAPWRFKPLLWFARLVSYIQKNKPLSLI